MISKVFLALLTLSISWTTALAAERFIGEWAGEDATSIEITSENPLTVMYCIKSECNEWKPRGTAEDMTFDFPAGERFPGATMTMKRDGDLYQGWYQQTGAKISYKVTLVKG